jgi:hypothetical protein
MDACLSYWIEAFFADEGSNRTVKKRIAIISLSLILLLVAAGMVASVVGAGAIAGNGGGGPDAGGDRRADHHG